MSLHHGSEATPDIPGAGKESCMTSVLFFFPISPTSPFYYRSTYDGNFIMWHRGTLVPSSFLDTLLEIFIRDFLYCLLLPFLFFSSTQNQTACFAFAILKICYKYPPLMCPWVCGERCSLFRLKKHLSTVYGKCASCWRLPCEPQWQKCVPSSWDPNAKTLMRTARPEPRQSGWETSGSPRAFFCVEPMGGLTFCLLPYRDADGC